MKSRTPKQGCTACLSCHDDSARLHPYSLHPPWKAQQPTSTSAPLLMLRGVPRLDIRRSIPASLPFMPLGPAPALDRVLTPSASLHMHTSFVSTMAPWNYTICLSSLAPINAHKTALQHAHGVPLLMGATSSSLLLRVFFWGCHLQLRCMAEVHSPQVHLGKYCLSVSC